MPPNPAPSFRAQCSRPAGARTQVVRRTQRSGDRAVRLATTRSFARGRNVRRLIVLTSAIAAIALLAWQSTGAALGAAPRVSVIRIDGTIDSLTAGHIERTLDQAHNDAATLFVIQLDTPGGRLDSTREIVEHMLESEIPIAVYVSPAGARAASAGTFVLAAAHVAVMAPGTSVGAATPVGTGGADLPVTLSRKVSEGTQAFIRSIAQVRNRNASALEATVSKALAYSAQEAVEQDIADLIVPDMNSMLEQLHGRTVETAAGQVVISSVGGDVTRVDRTLIERALDILANPNVVLALFLIGGLAVLVEVSAPGMLAPGIAGAIALALAFVGFFSLPGSWGGLLLIAVALGLFYAEAAAPGFSLFGAGGLVALVLGSVFLFGDTSGPSDFPEPSYMVSPIMIAVAAGLTAVTWVLFIRFVRVEGGTSSGFQTEDESQLEGAWGVALSDLEPSGRVRIASKEWAASTDPGVSIRKGDEVRVTGVYGQVLKVERLLQERKR